MPIRWIGDLGSQDMSKWNQVLGPCVSLPGLLSKIGQASPGAQTTEIDFSRLCGVEGPDQGPAWLFLARALFLA